MTAVNDMGAPTNAPVIIDSTSDSEGTQVTKPVSESKYTDYKFRRHSSSVLSPGTIIETNHLSQYLDRNNEAYTSHWEFNEEAVEYFNTNRNKNGNQSIGGYQGPCYTPVAYFDLDREDLSVAIADCQALLRYLIDTMGFTLAQCQVWFSGRKGFHVGIPTSPWGLEPSPDFNSKIKAIYLHIAKEAGVIIDPALYDKVRLLRLPFSKHPKSQLHKIPLQVEAVLGGLISAEWIIQNA